MNNGCETGCTPDAQDSGALNIADRPQWIKITNRNRMYKQEHEKHDNSFAGQQCKCRSSASCTWAEPRTPLNTMAWFLEKAGYTAKPNFALTIQEISRSTR